MRINWRVINRQYLINLVTADHQLTINRQVSPASISAVNAWLRSFIIGFELWETEGES